MEMCVFSNGHFLQIVLIISSAFQLERFTVVTLFTEGILH